jgi:hypothetical protein
VHSSPFSAASTLGSDDVDSESSIIRDEDESASGSSESGEGESTSMSLDSGIATVDSFMSARSSNQSNASSVRLEEALRQAAVQAGTAGIEFDENGDLSMELADDQVTAAFKPWVKGKVTAAPKLPDLTSLHDQENRNPFSPAFRAAFKTLKAVRPELSGDETLDEEEEFSMEMTRAVGGILGFQQKAQEFAKSSRRESIAITQRRKSLDRSASREEVSLGETSSLEDATMDLTMAIGGIQQGAETILVETPSHSLPTIEEATSVHTPPNQADTLDSPNTPSMQEQELGSVVEDMDTSIEQPVEKIGLEEFLDLVGIQFIDLTASKRRLKDSSSGVKIDGLDEVNAGGDSTSNAKSKLENYVVAASSTLPMLEMYQHVRVSTFLRDRM